MKFSNKIFLLISFLFLILIILHLFISNWHFLILDIGSFSLVSLFWLLLLKKESEKLMIVLLLFSLIFIFELFSTSFLSLNYADWFSHFFGGICLAWGISIYFKNDIEKTSTKLKKIFLICCLCFFFFVSWELLEFLFDFYIGNYFLFPMLSPSLKDLFKDFLMDFLGVFVFLLRKKFF